MGNTESDCNLALNMGAPFKALRRYPQNLQKEKNNEYILYLEKYINKHRSDVFKANHVFYCACVKNYKFENSCE